MLIAPSLSSLSSPRRTEIGDQACVERDVVDIDLQVVAGVLKGNKIPLGDGVDANDVPLKDEFPYLADPGAGANPKAAHGSQLKGAVRPGQPNHKTTPTAQSAGADDGSSPSTGAWIAIIAGALALAGLAFTAGRRRTCTKPVRRPAGPWAPRPDRLATAPFSQIDIPPVVRPRHHTLARPPRRLQPRSQRPPCGPGLDMTTVTAARRGRRATRRTARCPGSVQQRPQSRSGRAPRAAGVMSGRTPSRRRCASRPRFGCRRARLRASRSRGNQTSECGLPTPRWQRPLDRAHAESSPP